jgi:hypothetical protein
MKIIYGLDPFILKRLACEYAQACLTGLSQRIEKRSPISR